MNCPTCHGANADDAQWCTQCYLALDGTLPFLPEPESPEASASLAFGTTSSVTLRPMVPGKPLLYFNPLSDQPEARVLVNELPGGAGAEWGALLSGRSTHHLQERHTCFDLDDIALFYVERYGATDNTAFVVCDPDGTPLATYVPYGDIFKAAVVLRDGTGAPVASIRPESGRLEITETGGRVLGFCWREDCDLIDVVDDAWGLTMFEQPRLLDRRAVVAAPLVCRLLSHRKPRPKERGASPRSAVAGWAGSELALQLVQGLPDLFLM